MITSPAITLGTASRPKLSPDGKTVTVAIPITLRRLGGRKQVITPSSSQSRTQQQPQVNATLVKRSPARITGARCWNPISKPRSATSPKPRTSTNPTSAAPCA